MHRKELVNYLKGYQTSFQEENEFIAPFLSLLLHPQCFERTNLPGHITGSAWVIDSSRSQVVLVHHVKLDKWVQPGGHADGDENILRVALKEAEEETGLKNIISLGSLPFDIDLHQIPQRPDFPAHYHYDVRFLFEADPGELIQVSEESHDVKWIRFTELEKYSQERSILRMKEKLF